MNNDGSQGLERRVALSQKCHRSLEASENLKLFHVFGCLLQIREDQHRHLDLEKKWPALQPSEQENRR